MRKKHRERARNRPKGQVAITGHYVYEKYMQALPKRVEFVGRNLHLFNTMFAALFSDENFITLLRAESVTIPNYLKPLLEGATRAHEID